MFISSFQSGVKELNDHRQSHKLLYPLDEILLLTLCTVISGCETFVDIVEYGKTKLSFLRKPVANARAYYWRTGSTHPAGGIQLSSFS